MMRPGLALFRYSRFSINHDSGSRHATGATRPGAGVRARLPRGVAAHCIHAWICWPRAAPVLRDVGPLLAARSLAASGRPYGGIPRLARVSGMAPAAAPVLR